MLMNWPNFSAAPLIRPNVDTNLLILASLMNTLPVALLPPAVRRRPSEAAPIPIDAARAKYQRESHSSLGVEKLTSIVEESANPG
jgi:hypothetical protein